MTYAWDFGDGARGGSVTLARTFAVAGTYPVTLTVLDNAGQAASETQSIVVSAAPAPGPAVQVTGLIADLGNTPIARVVASVVGGSATTTSDAQGHVTLMFATASDVIVKLSKSGFADQFVPVRLPATAGSDAYFEAHMIAREPAQTLADATQGGIVAGKNGATAAFAGGSLVDTTGHVVTGAVQVSMTPVDVTSTAIVAFPGRFQGTTNAALSTAIVSYGTVEYILTQNGQRVQLVPGATATIEIPAFPNANADGSALMAGNIVPLWSLDETTGLWTQEGVGTVVASAGSPTGLALRATVGHFSWWNMDAPIDGDFKPKPKCQDAGSGTPGSTDHLANATICNMLALFAGASGEASGSFAPGGSARAQIAAAASQVLKPGYGGVFSIPMAGGVSIALPANKSMTLHATALNGTWIGQVTVIGTATDTPDIIIPMNPVASAPVTQTITLPFDQTLGLGANQSAQFSFSAVGNKSVKINIASGQGSTFIGQARLLQGSTVLATTTISNLVATLSATTLPAGDYVIEIDNTGPSAATFSLQAAYIHWASQGPLLSGIQFPMGALALLYDAQGQAVVMDSEDYFPNPNISNPALNAHLVFRRLVAGAWTTIATPVELGTGYGLSPPVCAGFALDRNGNPSYVLQSADRLSYTVNQWNGTAWQTIGPNAGVLPQANDGRLCSSPPDLAVNASNQPIVGYDASGQLFVQRFDGTAWQGLGPNNGRVTPTGLSNPLFAHSMKLDSTDTPVVEWNTGGNTNPGQVAFVVRFAASPTPAWVGVGPNGGRLPTPTAPGLTFEYLAGANLVLDANDRPLVAGGVFGFDSANQTITATAGFKFDGTQWAASDIHRANAAGVVSLASQSSLGAFVDDTGQLMVAWAEHANASTGALQYYVQSWPGSGTLWLGLGSTLGLVDNPTLNLYPTLRLTKDSSGNPAIAFAKVAGLGSGAVNVGVTLFVP